MKFYGIIADIKPCAFYVGYILTSGGDLIQSPPAPTTAAVHENLELELVSKFGHGVIDYVTWLSDDELNSDKGYLAALEVYREKVEVI